MDHLWISNNSYGFAKGLANFSGFYSALFYLISPNMLATFAIFIHLASDLKKILRSESNRSKDDFSNGLTMAGKLIDTLECFETTFGNYTLVEVSVCLINMILGPFMFTAVLDEVFSKETGDSFGLSFYLSTFSFITAVISLVKIYALFKLGQGLANEWRNLKSTLQLMCIENAEKMSQQDNLILDVISLESGVLRPKDCFDLKASTALSAGGILVTYIAVLIQFRLSDNV